MMRIVEAGGAGMSGLFLILMLWLLGKVIETVWSALRDRKVDQDSKSRAQKMREIYALEEEGPVSALSKEAKAVIKDVDHAVESVLKKAIENFK